MSVLEEVLLEEYERSLRISAALEEEIAGLPRGSIRVRKVRGREYYYLQYRDGKRVKSDYVKSEDVERVREQIELRRNDVAALKEQRRSQRQIEKALGKEALDGRARG